MSIDASSVNQRKRCFLRRPCFCQLACLLACLLAFPSIKIQKISSQKAVIPSNFHQFPEISIPRSCLIHKLCFPEIFLSPFSFLLLEIVIDNKTFPSAVGCKAIRCDEVTLENNHSISSSEPFSTHLSFSLLMWERIGGRA
jgi:hypothetical protein